MGIGNYGVIMNKIQRVKLLVSHFRNIEATWYLGILPVSGKFISTDNIINAAEFIVKNQDVLEPCTIYNNVDDFDKMAKIATTCVGLTAKKVFYLNEQKNFISPP